MRVSVVCPVYDTAPELLRAAARSVLDQGDRVAELILSDDASTDPATRAELATLAVDPRVRLLRAAPNAGPAQARNAALAAASGDWVAFIDADDLWAPVHLARIEAARAVAPHNAWFCAHHERLEPGGARTTPAPFTTAHPGEPLAPGLTRHRNATRALIGNYWLHLGGCVVRTDLARACGFDARCLYSEDWLFFLRLSVRAPLVFLAAPTYTLRRAHASLTTSPRRLTRARATGKRAALADPDLAPFRRELRWALIATYKALAANNLLAGHPARAAWFAGRAYAMDPRELAEATRFARALTRRTVAGRRRALTGYTTAEITPS